MKKSLMISLMAAVFSVNAAAEQYATIKGSDTMVHLGSFWAEAFMKENTGTDISVTGGGSGTGIAALLNGTTDICMASRKIKPKEIKLAEQKNIVPVEFVVARDGIAVVVNPENPIDSLTVERIGKIYSGAYTNWMQVGGPDQKIVVLSRESSSGTYVFFQEHVLKKQDYTSAARLMPATSTIIQSVEEDKWAIGYVGLGYALEAGEKVKMLAVGEDGVYIKPTVTSIKSGEYSISRPLHLYTNGEPSGLVRKFVDFCLSSEGQQIVRDTGYIDILK
jgi:phosphate transport system substrate-binding protein